MRTAIRTGSDFSGVGAMDQAYNRLGVVQEKAFACDMDKYARRNYILNYGTKEDLEILNTEICKRIDNTYYAGIVNTKLVPPTDEDWKFIEDFQEEVARSFSFYYPWDVYKREIPEEPLDCYGTTPPCQAFSISGKRLGKEDRRGILFFNSLEFIKKNKPKTFWFENVKGLLSHDKVDKSQKYGRTFNEWLNYLGGKSINGKETIFPYEDSVPYHIYYQVLNAKEFGVPQNRERVFIIGIRDDIDNNFSFPKPFPLEKRLKDILEKESDFESKEAFDEYMKKYFLSDDMISYLMTRKDNFNNGKINFKDENDIASIITKSSSSIDVSDNIIKIGFINQDTQASQVLSDEGIFSNICAGTHGYANGYVQLEEIIQLNDPVHSNDRIYSDEGISPTLNTMQGGNRQPFVQLTEENSLTIIEHRGHLNKEPKFITNGIAPCLRAESHGHETKVMISSNTAKGFDFAEEEEDSINFSQPNSKTRRGRVGKKVSQTLDTQCNQGVFTQQKIRRLTPRECFRLMDFPDSFDFSGVSDSQAYKQAGNSICVEPLKLLLEKTTSIILNQNK